MSGSVLSRASAFNPGSDLWILPHAEQHSLVKDIDWYLGFQLARKQRHVSPYLSHQIQQLLQATEFPYQDYSTSAQAPLLIPSLQALPCRWLVVMPQLDFKVWVDQAHKVWSDLQKPNVRFFIPQGQNAGSFSEIWQTYTKNSEYSLVLD
ncbi:MAG: hypothetical protein ACLGGX_02605 [Bdellovibrionia bacterium]